MNHSMFLSKIDTLNKQAIDLLMSRQYDLAIQGWMLLVNELKREISHTGTRNPEKNASESCKASYEDGVNDVRTCPIGCVCINHHFEPPTHFPWNENCINLDTDTHTNGMFLIYDRAFLLPTQMMREYYSHDLEVLMPLLSALVLYNIGLTHHLASASKSHCKINGHTAMATTSSHHRQALKFYHMSLHLFDCVNQCETQLKYTYPLPLAIVNNLGCIHSELYNHVEIMQCRMFVLENYADYRASTSASLSSSLTDNSAAAIRASMTDPTESNAEQSNSISNTIRLDDFNAFFSLSIVLLHQKFIASPAA
jgi:hypothetical protein